jgi:serine/threonine protein phosphatase PrpC
VFSKLQEGLTNSDINVTCSGSTFVGVFLDSDEIVCANVGDSRAILARQSNTLPYAVDRKSWELIYLSQDHKPSIEAERKRIIKSGGRVHAFRDENGQPVGPQRVWLPNQSSSVLIQTCRGWR